MATYGSTSTRICTSNSPEISCGWLFYRVGRPILWSLALALFMVSLIGCASAPVLDFGRPVPVGKITTLQVGVSTPDDVRALLGPPRGDGITRHFKEKELRTIWYYEYGQIKDDQVALKIVLVFFKGDRYDGHLWFSSKELVEVEWM